MSFGDAKEMSFKDMKEISFKDENEISFLSLNLCSSVVGGKEISFSVSFEDALEDAKEMSLGDTKEISFKGEKEISFFSRCQTPYCDHSSRCCSIQSLDPVFALLANGGHAELVLRCTGRLEPSVKLSPGSLHPTH